jgi:hypothetical protein
MASRRSTNRLQLQAPPERRWTGDEQKDDILDASIRTSAQMRRQQEQQQQQQHQAPADVHIMRQPSSGGGSAHGSIIAPSPSTLSATHSLSQHSQQQSISVESPLPPMVQRSLGDRSNEKRKNAALEIEALIKSLHEANNTAVIQSIITVLSKDFCTSMNSNYRKGGLIGLAATAIGLMQDSRKQLDVLLPPVLHCFDDPESRVRYYACESLYNIAKVSRMSILEHFNEIFEGLAKLFADGTSDKHLRCDLLVHFIKELFSPCCQFVAFSSRRRR